MQSQLAPPRPQGRSVHWLNLRLPSAPAVGRLSGLLADLRLAVIGLAVSVIVSRGNGAQWLAGGIIVLALAGILRDRSGGGARRRVLDREAAVAAERSRLAREMHDSLAKSLHGIVLAAAALPTWVQRHPEKAAQQASAIAEAAAVASMQARELIAGLRQERPDRALAGAVRETVRAWSEVHPDLEVSVEVDDHVELPIGAERQLTCILNEALENVARHARARTVQVGLGTSGGWAVLRVADDGRGFRVPESASRLREAGHYGLLGAHERALQTGGRLDVRSTPGGGTVVLASIPLVSRAGFDVTDGGARS